MDTLIRFVNGEEIPALGVHSQPIFYNGIERDHLIFLFDPSVVDIAKVQELFYPENCKHIAIVQGEEEFVHSYYTIPLGYGYGNRLNVLNTAINTSKDTMAGETPELETVVFAKMIRTTVLEREVEVQGEALTEVVRYLADQEAGVSRLAEFTLQDILEMLISRR